MHDRSDVARVLELVAAGASRREIVRLTGVPRSTIDRWASGRVPGNAPGDRCPRCGDRQLDRAAYCYLLGLYLGDGTLVQFRNGTWRLEIYQDATYPRLVEHCRTAMSVVIGRPAATRRKSGCVVINTYSTHWPCLFPQAGPGKKHERAIRLEPWQQRLVESHPRPFLRGLIESDGDRHLNRIAKPGGGHYVYRRYGFTNRSADILSLFEWACCLVGVRCTAPAAFRRTVSRAADVALLDSFIGPKS